MKRQTRSINVNSFVFKERVFRDMYHRIKSNNYHGDLLVCKTGTQGEIYKELKKSKNKRLNWLVLLEISFNNKESYANEVGKRTGNRYTIYHSSINDIETVSL